MCPHIPTGEISSYGAAFCARECLCPTFLSGWGPPCLLGIKWANPQTHLTTWFIRTFLVSTISVQANPEADIKIGFKLVRCSLGKTPVNDKGRGGRRGRELSGHHEVYLCKKRKFVILDQRISNFIALPLLHLLLTKLSEELKVGVDGKA